MDPDHYPVPLSTSSTLTNHSEGDVSKGVPNSLESTSLLGLHHDPEHTVVIERLPPLDWEPPNLEPQPARGDRSWLEIQQDKQAGFFVAIGATVVGMLICGIVGMILVSEDDVVRNRNNLTRNSNTSNSRNITTNTMPTSTTTTSPRPTPLPFCSIKFPGNPYDPVAMGGYCRSCVPNATGPTPDECGVFCCAKYFQNQTSQEYNTCYTTCFT